MTNGNYTNEIEYMIHLKKNNKLTIISSPVGYLRAIRNSIPLNWKEDVLEKKQKAEKKELEKTRILMEAKADDQKKARKTALCDQALKDWNAMTQEARQPWFDIAKQQQDDKAQKGLPVFRRNDPKHLWAAARVSFIDEKEKK